MKLYWPEMPSFDETFQLFQQEKLSPMFSNEIMEFTQALSKRFLKLRHIPEVVALGYWLRKSNIQQLKKEFEENNQSAYVKARGIVFHIAPSNVDTIFIYSWMLSLLAGNKNIIRISNKAEVTELMKIVLEELGNYELIGKQTIICTYAHDEYYTKSISENCHTRVIWGGDQTIKSIRNISLAPLANELAFADRFSLAVINRNELKNLEEQELDKLIDDFYNDSFWFNQMACSSPRLVVWVGEGDTKTFWDALERKIEQKNYETFASVQMKKFVTALQLSAESFVEKVEVKSNLSKVSLKELPNTVKEQHCGGGLFYELEVNDLNDAISSISDKDQTVAYFGFSKDQLNQFAMNINSRGIDRIVPIGQALNFDGIWDGQSFLNSFTRKIVIK